jgi:hypothetical protein
MQFRKDKTMNIKTLALTVGALTIAATSLVAAVGSGYTLFGGATYVMPGNASNRAVSWLPMPTREFTQAWTFLFQPA